MDFTVIDTGLVAKLLLLLLVGMGPKIALVPFLEMTHTFDAATKATIGRKMVLTAIVTALIIFATGALADATVAYHCRCGRDRRRHCPRPPRAQDGGWADRKAPWKIWE